MLKEQITLDMKSALRAREAQRLGTIRLLLAAILQREIDERIVLDDAAIITIIERLIKQRREAIELYVKAERMDRAVTEELEIKVLQQYLPQALSSDEITAMIRKAMGEAPGATLGQILSVLKPQIAGRAPMAEVSKQVRELLADV